MSEVSIEKILSIKDGEGVAAAGRIPQDLELFKDHFPAFPVLPGVLSLDILKQTAEEYFKKTEQRQCFLKEVKAVKFIKYLRPDDEWESKLRLVSMDEARSVWDAKLFVRGEAAASAKLIFQN